SDCSHTSTPSGMWLATRVGRPMPRLTYMPSLSSCAARLAISSRVQAMSAASSHGALLDALLGVRVVHDAVHIDARQVHVVGVDVTDLHDLLHLGDAHLPGHRTGGIEVSRGLAEDQVPGLVRLPRLHQRYVGDQRGLHDVVLAVEL